MPDRLSTDERSRLMSRIRSKDTKPEWSVHRLVHGMGYRYVLHDRRLPSTPDLCSPGGVASPLCTGASGTGTSAAAGVQAEGTRRLLGGQDREEPSA